MKYVICCMTLLLASVATAGSITGTATYEGKVPNLRPVDMSADPVCYMKRGGEPAPSEMLVLGEGQTLGNIFVEVVKGLPEKEYPVPEEAVVMTQAGCQYTPRVFGIRAGQTLKIQNPDGTLHNVNAVPKVNRPFNRGMPPELREIEVVFDKPEPLFTFRCDVHSWMRGYCAVMDHPYFDTTKADGKFRIEDLPPGDYTLRATHEKLGEKTATVILEEGKDAIVNFTFSR